MPGKNTQLQALNTSKTGPIQDGGHPSNGNITIPITEIEEMAMLHKKALLSINTKDKKLVKLQELLLSERNNAKSAADDRLREKLELTNRITDLHFARATLEKENQALRAQLGEMETQAKNRIHALTSQNQGLLTELASAQSHNKSLTRLQCELEMEREALSTELVRIRSETERLVNAQYTLSLENHRLSSELDKGLIENAQAKETIDKLVDSVRHAIQCDICYEPIHSPALLRCGHMYCSDCLMQWAGGSVEKVSCPSCRLVSDIAVTTLHILRRLPHL